MSKEVRDIYIFIRMSVSNTHARVIVLRMNITRICKILQKHMKLDAR